MKLGMIQGRLLRPEDGGIQEFPVCWEEEFDRAKNLGLNHIEWIVTSENFYNNPLFHEDLSNYFISSVCADFMVDDRFCNGEYLDEFLRMTCDAVIRYNINSITIPLLEKSDVSNKEIMDNFINVFYPYTEKFKTINFLIEAELSYKKLKKILELNDNVFVTYDTGNITSCGFDHKEYLHNTITKIKNIHLKDRTKKPITTVDPFTGDTDFDLIFKILNKLGYNGKFTIQTARGDTGKEIETIKKHKEKFKKLYYEKFI